MWNCTLCTLVLSLVRASMCLYVRACVCVFVCIKQTGIVSSFIWPLCPEDVSREQADAPCGRGAWGSAMPPAARPASVQLTGRRTKRTGKNRENGKELISHLAAALERTKWNTNMRICSTLSLLPHRWCNASRNLCRNSRGAEPRSKVATYSSICPRRARLSVSLFYYVFLAASTWLRYCSSHSAKCIFICFMSS